MAHKLQADRCGQSCTCFLTHEWAVERQIRHKLALTASMTSMPGPSARPAHSPLPTGQICSYGIFVIPACAGMTVNQRLSERTTLPCHCPCCALPGRSGLVYISAVNSPMALLAWQRMLFPDFNPIRMAQPNMPQGTHRV